jgi:eight-cysteine-cluster-containing protein
MKGLILGIIAIALIGVGVAVFDWLEVGAIKDSTITSFEECAAAGNPVMESHPRQCRTEGGKLFVENIAVEVPNPSNGNVVRGGCVVTGCSGQICAEASEAGDIITTCEFRPEYACYRNATCERQNSGQCGWTQDAALTACLANPTE